jgi:hypothetical protein
MTTEDDDPAWKLQKLRDILDGMAVQRTTEEEALIELQWTRKQLVMVTEILTSIQSSSPTLGSIRGHLKETNIILVLLVILMAAHIIHHW